jgi:hypothetical protein
MVSSRYGSTLTLRATTLSAIAGRSRDADPQQASNKNVLVFCGPQGFSVL